jgi:nucleotide-binding universal stress UspA family protein
MSDFPANLLLATDGSPDAALAARAAADLSGTTEAKLHVVHVGKSLSAYARPVSMPKEDYSFLSCSDRARTRRARAWTCPCRRRRPLYPQT